MSDITFQKEIAQGVTLCCVKTDRFKTSKVHISMAVPLEGDIAARALVPYILRRSCRKYPDFRSLNGHLDMLYGAALAAGADKLGESQIVKMSISSIDDRFSMSEGENVCAQAAELLLDLLFDPNVDNGCFKEDDIELEKRLMTERVMSEADDKRHYALVKCCEKMCENEPYGKHRYGTLEQISALTAAQVYSAWTDLLRRSVIRVVVVGSSDSESIENMLRSRFGEIERSPSTLSTVFIPSADSVKYFSEEQPVKQGKLVMGFRVGMADRDDYNNAMTVMSDIFGGGTYSKLFSNVREKMSLCYYCSSRLDREKGLLFVQSGIETENEEKAKTAILEQLDAVKAGDFTDEIISSSLLSLSESLKSYGDSPDVLCTWYSSQIVSGTAKTPQQRIEELESVTFNDVVAAAQNITLDTVFMLIGTEDSHDEA